MHLLFIGHQISLPMDILTQEMGYLAALMLRLSLLSPCNIWILTWPHYFLLLSQEATSFKKANKLLVPCLISDQLVVIFWQKISALSWLLVAFPVEI